MLHKVNLRHWIDHHADLIAWVVSILDIYKNRTVDLVILCHQCTETKALTESMCTAFLLPLILMLCMRCSTNDCKAGHVSRTSLQELILVMLCKIQNFRLLRIQISRTEIMVLRDPVPVIQSHWGWQEMCMRSNRILLMKSVKSYLDELTILDRDLSWMELQVI